MTAASPVAGESLLSRYLDAETLGRLAARPFVPRSLVLGQLAGGHKSPASGFAIEFAGHREYFPGDDPRHIDWRLYFRRERYFIKQYEMETNFVCHLVLDATASMRYGEGAQRKLNHAGTLLTTMAYAILKQSDRVTVSFVDAVLRTKSNRWGRTGHVTELVETLDLLETGSETEIGRALEQLAPTTSRREIVMVFSDLLTDLESLERGLQRLRYQQHEVVLFHVLHADETAFPLSGPIRFQGLEGAEEYQAQAEDLREAYLEQVAEYLRNLDELCLRNGVERVPVDTSVPPANGLGDYLESRRRLTRRR